MAGRARSLRLRPLDPDALKSAKDCAPLGNRKRFRGQGDGPFFRPEPVEVGARSRRGSTVALIWRAPIDANVSSAASVYVLKKALAACLVASLAEIAAWSRTISL